MHCVVLCLHNKHVNLSTIRLQYTIICYAPTDTAKHVKQYVNKHRCQQANILKTIVHSFMHGNLQIFRYICHCSQSFLKVLINEFRSETIFLLRAWPGRATPIIERGNFGQKFETHIFTAMVACLGSIPT